MGGGNFCYSVIGGVAWATGVTLLGYWLGAITFVKDHLELILVGIVAMSFIPILIEAVRARRASRVAPGAGVPHNPGAGVPQNPGAGVPHNPGTGVPQDTAT